MALLFALGHCKSAGTQTSNVDASHPIPRGDAASTGAVVTNNAEAVRTRDAEEVFAIVHYAPIYSAMEMPPKREEERKRWKHQKLGYLRQGSHARVASGPHKRDNCKDGWYELESGGFVCSGKYVSTDANHPKLAVAPHPPYFERSLPYEYASNIVDGTPLYRSAPKRAMRVKFEPWLSGRIPRRPRGEQLDASPTALEDYHAALEAEFDGGVPWYLRDWDGGKPQVTLDELQEEGGPLVRRMVRGFYVALDTEVEADHTKWWRTTKGHHAPFERMARAKLMTDFHGVWLNQKAEPPAFPPPTAQPDGGVPAYYVDKPPTHLPVGIVWLPKSKKYRMSDDQKHVTPTGETLARFTPLQLVGKGLKVEGAEYFQLEDGSWVREGHVIVTDPGRAPRDLAPNEKWIDVNLDTQSLVAFEGTTPVYATLISSGRKNRGEEKNYESRPGEFRIREKHVASTMDGDVASDGPYSIEDVPWIMYYDGSYALHGAFWHVNFGRQQSHGCINLAPADARALFGWTEPRLPDGWHGVWASPTAPGTRVVVRTTDPPP